MKPNRGKITLPASVWGTLEDLADDPQAQLQFVHAVLLYERERIETPFEDRALRLFFNQAKREIDQLTAKRLDVSEKRRAAADLANAVKRANAAARALERPPVTIKPVATRPPIAVPTVTPKPRPAQILGKDGKPLSKQALYMRRKRQDPNFRKQENRERSQRRAREKGTRA